VAARAYAGEAIDRAGMPCDTTARSRYGDYAQADGTREVPPRHGHSTDHRPDLKQIRFTCFVNRAGVPRMGTVADGTRSDKRLHRDQMDRIVRTFSPPALRDMVYLADSALVTGPNWDTLAAADLAWLSRLPDTLGVAATRKAAAWEGAAWIPAGRVAEAPRGATYAASEQTGTMGDRAYRCVVYRSSSLDRRKVKTLARELTAGRAAAERAVDARTGQDLAWAAAAAAFRAPTPRWWPCTTTVAPVTVTDKRSPPGAAAPG
jgi:transposase